MTIVIVYFFFTDFRRILFITKGNIVQIYDLQWTYDISMRTIKT